VPPRSARSVRACQDKRKAREGRAEGGEREGRVARTMRRTPGVPGSLSVVLYLAPIVIDPIAAAAAAAVARAAPRSRSPASEQSRWCGEKG
jgi:hypothetical protein